MVMRGVELVERAVSTVTAIVILVVGLDILALTPPPGPQERSVLSAHHHGTFGLTDEMSDAIRE